MSEADTPPTAGETPELIEQQKQAAEAEARAAQPDNAPAPVVPTTPADESEPETVLVSVDQPFYQDAFVASDTLTVDRKGVLVPKDDVADLVNAASQAGISLKVG